MPWLPAPDLPSRWLPCSLRSAAVLAELLCPGAALEDGALDGAALLADPGCTAWLLRAFPAAEPASALACLRNAELAPLLLGDGLPDPPGLTPHVQQALLDRFAVQHLAAECRPPDRTPADSAAIAWLTAQEAQALGRSFTAPPAIVPVADVNPPADRIADLAAGVHRAWQVVLDPPSATDAERALLREAMQSAAQALTLWRQEWPGPGRNLQALARLVARTNAAAATAAELESAKLAALAEFAAGAGHDMNNPLAVISARAQLLLRGESSPERRNQLAIIQAQVQRVHEMIVDVMLFARPPALRRQALKLGPLLAEQIARLQELPTWSGVRIEHAQTGEVPLVEGDADLLRPLWAALLQNAHEALGGAGVITVELRGAESTNDRAPGVEVRISNDGPAIPEATRAHLFDPFYSGRQAGRGLGFGLSKAWRIATLHGGSLSAERVAQGAAFRVWLPVATKEPSRGS